ncbi:MAG: alanine--tRNA ligase [Candidatus Acidiferrales bacterium]
MVRSSSLVPANDPTLLFTNAGMNQFKDVFLGLEKRDYNRATTCQKCVRAGGKHNDLENVGYTNRHLTFFEMLGNFSFGDYFKADAIAFAWELITSPNCFAIPKEKLFVTIFKGEAGIERDSEAYDGWLAQGVSKDRIYEFGSSENFWAMGETGPCGPCSEIYYDMGPAASDKGHPECALGCDCGRYVEIWNLVFMQFNRLPAVTGDAEGVLNPLPRPSVDTGAGLDRLTSVLQGKISIFDTDLFQPLMSRAAELSGASLGDTKSAPSLRILADHSRAATFLISDGVIPSNEGRGYVLRKILRRAIDHGRKLGIDRPFLVEMASKVTEEMKSAYPELVDLFDHVSKTLVAEEEKYSRLMVPAVDRFAARLESKAKSRSGEFNRIDGADLFFAYDTLGLRPDFIRDLAQEHGWQISGDADQSFEEELKKQRERAKASWKGAAKEAANPAFARLAETFKTEPDFYFGTSTRDCRIEAIVTRKGQVNEIPAGAEAEVVLDRSAIYAESGGQVADTGAFFDNSESLAVAEVRGAYYPVAGLIAHRIVAREKLQVGDRVATVADAARRARNKRNHTATHLMHAALRNILGTHVKQAGSLVAPEHLRFDFSHFEAVEHRELEEIEQQVNEEILRDLEIRTDIASLDEALASGALAFFGDKYPESNVRVVTIADDSYARGFYSKELCGGTHTNRTGEIGVFKIQSEQSVAAGVRRIDAVTGDAALTNYQQAYATLRDLAARLKSAPAELPAAIERLEEQTRQLEKQLEAHKRKSAHSMVDSLAQETRTVKNVKVLASRVSGLDREGMRQLVDALRQRLGSGVVVLISGEDGKVSLITGVTKDLTPRVHAGKIIQELARLVGGSGGGRPDLAEAGGKDTSGIEMAIARVVPLLEGML